MDLSDPHTFRLFLEVYGTLPRAGPGGTEQTLRALRMVPGDPPVTILDLGCGPGAQTLALAEAMPASSILALDLLPSMVEQARRRCREAGVGDRARVVIGDMSALPLPPGSQDLIWCEGAIYFVGVEDALRSWRSLLAPGGTIAFTEPVWLRPSPPDKVREWWHGQYPAITDEQGVRAAVDAASFDTVGFFPLPAESWWDEYYGPMQPRIDSLRKLHPDDPAAAEVTAAAEEEIDFFRRFSDCYSYGFFVVRPRR